MVNAVWWDSWFAVTIWGSSRCCNNLSDMGTTIRPLKMVSWMMRGKGGGGEVPGVADHKGHLFLGEVLRGDYEVAFVFAVGGVEDYDEFAAGC